MREIMMEAGFPEDAVEDLLEKAEKLKENGKWETLMALAEETMDAYPGKNLLDEKLEKAEAMEEKTGISRYTLDMLMLLQCWKVLKKRYEEKGMSVELFDNALKDAAYKLQECRAVYGINGTFVGGWNQGFFAMTRFALGRLQFEMLNYPFDEPFVQDGVTVKKRDPVINMHIPSSGPLRKEAAEDAIRQAAEFFGKEFPDGRPVFVMASWLLDTDLMKLLPEGNTREFVKRFTVLQVNKSDVFEDGWRVFTNEWTEEFEKLPGRTKLQRAIRGYLQQGGKLGYGYGIFIG